MTPHLVALLPLQNTEVSHNLLLAKKIKKKRSIEKKRKKKGENLFSVLLTIQQMYQMLHGTVTRTYKG